MAGYGTVANQFRAKWGKNPRLDVIAGYLDSRVRAIDARLWETFRYVDQSPDNKGTFSYEFSSILRDCGSAFDSAMRELLRTVRYPKPKREYDIRDYRNFLVKNVDRQAFQQSSPGGIETVVLALDSSWAKRYVMPFKGLENGGTTLEWWDAYNDVKHSDLEKVAQGNLSNAVNALGAVVVLNVLIGVPGRYTKSFDAPIFHEPMNEILARLF